MNFSVDFGEFLYNKLPEVYRSNDKDNELTLKRFIDVLNTGGFSTIIEGLTGIDDILDIDKCPTKYLPYVGRLFGYESTEELPEWFQRLLLRNIVELYKRKGTKSALNFIAREMSGFESEIIEFQDKFFRTWSSNPHYELANYTVSKTYNTLNTDLSYLGYGNKYNYKNFYLVLKAPYELNNLVEKEEAVIKTIEQFKPTHSTIYVVTVYWFSDDKNFTEETSEIFGVDQTHYSDLDTKELTIDLTELVKEKLVDKGYIDESSLKSSGLDIVNEAIILKEAVDIFNSITLEQLNEEIVYSDTDTKVITSSILEVYDKHFTKMGYETDTYDADILEEQPVLPIEISDVEVTNLKPIVIYGINQICDTTTIDSFITTSTVESLDEINTLKGDDLDVITFYREKYDEALINRHNLNSRLYLNCKNGYDIIRVNSETIII